ncbi:phosphoglucomutase/phosphomannomutase family protein [bacterium]|nr:phosphoglucomutase/phosphomannomutase family protein [bacterium]MBU1781824.1 phosphoglucomutase/phosphomannomutase family protein [bacterium]MBU2600228.1 phosphoglucomutase/phosphomannomutase family protein [bacterium]
MGEITFGTSGWRAVMAEDFTFDKVKIVTQAISNYLKEKKEDQKGIIVGYDTRFMAEKFAEVAALVLAGNDIPVFLSSRDVPTPVISFEVIRKKLSGGINFTASHNPPEYQGIKFSSSNGGPALPSTTNWITEKAKILNLTQVKQLSSLKEGKERKLIEMIDPRNSYLERIKEIVDLEMITKANLKLIVDNMWGTGQGYLDYLLKKAGCQVEVLHNFRDPYFGGLSPEPAEENVTTLIQKVKDSGAHLGLATDGDADRFGIVDQGGRYIGANYIISLLYNYLLKTRGWQGVAVRSVATTHMVDAIAKKQGRKIIETPVGFKYVAEVMEREEIVIGAEESGGLTIKDHVPEKDGILACLLVAEMVALNKKSLTEILNELYQEVGTFINKRLNYHLSEEEKEKVLRRLKNNPPLNFAGLKVKEVGGDGFKFILEEGSWIMIRPSGTEPVVRCYLETDNLEKLQRLIKVSDDFIKG